MEWFFSLAEWVGKASLQGTFLAVTLWLLSRLRQSSGWFGMHYVLGIFIIARLCLPITPAWALHPFNWIASSKTVKASHEPIPHSVIAPGDVPFAASTALSPSTMSTLSNPSSSPSALAIESRAASIRWPHALAFIWAIGFGLSSIQVVRAHVRHRALLKACVPFSDQPTEDTVTTLSRDLGIHPPRMMRSHQVGSAAVTGFLRPKLILGEHFLHGLSQQQQRHVLTHELIHLRRCDPFVNGLTLILQAFHWFNPLIRWALKKFHADRELVCDALAIRHLGERQRRAYGETLITLLSAFRQQPAFPHLVPIVSNKNEIKRRIIMIATNQPNRRPIILIAGLSVILAIAFTRPAQVAAQGRAKSNATLSLDKADLTLDSIDVAVDVDLAPATFVVSNDHRLTLRDVESRIQGEGVVVAPGQGKQIYDINEIDTSAFETGGVLIIDVTVGDGASAASFDVFPAGTPLPHGFPKGSVARAYDVPPGQSRTLVHQFSQGQVFRLGASGNWFSEKGQTNEYQFEARAVPLSRPQSISISSGRIDVLDSVNVTTEMDFGSLNTSDSSTSHDLNITADTAVEFVPNTDILITKDKKTGKVIRRRVTRRSQPGTATLSTGGSVDQLILRAPSGSRHSNKDTFTYEFGVKKSDSTDSKASN